MSKIAVLAKLTAIEGKRDEVVKILSDQVAAVSGEAGTQIYALHIDPKDQTSIWFYELYADQAAFEFHGSTPAMAALGPKLKGLMGGRPELTILTPVVGKGI